METSKRLDVCTSIQARKNTKLGDILMFDKPEMSCGNFSGDALENVGMVPPKAAELYNQKKHIENKGKGNEELVRYMSNLPSYLQGGRNQQEKAFNVGVLDWNHLEMWQSKLKQIPSSSSGFSPSSSNASSFSSTEESSSSSDNFAEPLQGDSTSRDKCSKSSLERGENLAPHMMKVKLDFKSCKTIETCGRHGPSRMQALLQVAIMNGIHQFKFSVEKEGDSVAATMKKLTSSTKEKNNWIYTFCTIHEMRKKNRNWSNLRGKGRSHGYTSSTIAEMKVSDVPFPDIISQNSGFQSSISREFVLFNTDIKQAGQHSSELAAIVVKFSSNLHESDSIEGSDIAACSKNHDISMNVILPDGNHGLPRKGEPSSLIERWKSGGSCDCGGWDLGCKLRILVNNSDMGRDSISTKVQSSDGQFELFFQGEDQEKKPALRLCPFKDGILSVEYTSSLKLLQAFSICLAVLNIRNQYGCVELGKQF